MSVRVAVGNLFLGGLAYLDNLHVKMQVDTRQRMVAINRNLVTVDFPHHDLAGRTVLALRLKGHAWLELFDPLEGLPGHHLHEFLVDVYDETGETVALATILTMVKKLDQS